jgi:hypothetical protein
MQHAGALAGLSRRPSLLQRAAAAPGVDVGGRPAGPFAGVGGGSLRAFLLPRAAAAPGVVVGGRPAAGPVAGGGLGGGSLLLSRAVSTRPSIPATADKHFKELRFGGCSLGFTFSVSILFGSFLIHPFFCFRILIHFYSLVGIGSVSLGVWVIRCTLLDIYSDAVKKFEEEKAAVLKKFEEEKAAVLKKFEEEKAAVLKKFEEGKTDVLNDFIQLCVMRIRQPFRFTLFTAFDKEEEKKGEEEEKEEKK